LNNLILLFHENKSFSLKGHYFSLDDIEHDACHEVVRSYSCPSEVIINPKIVSDIGKDAA
jgi:hypothetical protein